MASSARRLTPHLLVLLLGCTALSGCASDSSAATADKSQPVAQAQPGAAQGPVQTLDGSVQQAQELRLAGNYAEAIRHLSQLMMVASDDPRVVSEYGKTLASMGRAQEAVNFLTRAQELKPGDWSVYSALGVAYDELGNQKDAGAAYERALVLKPGEPSVLSNYALSRMLANDPDGARKLMARALAAGGNADPVIARNIALIKDMAPETPAPPAQAVVAAAAAAPAVAAKPAAAPAPVATASGPAANAAPSDTSAAHTGAAAAGGPPRPLMPKVEVAAMPPVPARSTDNRVVMQAVPADPLAGPVAKARPVKAADARTQTPDAKPVDAKPADVKAAAAKPAKDAVPSLRMSANAY